jgi:AraC-like DNA-binding protein
MLLLITSFLSFFGAFLLLFFNKKQFAGNKYLAGMFFVNALYALVLYCMYFSGSSFWGAFFFGHFLPFAYLAGPFLFLYVRSLMTSNAQLQKWDWLHFVPFCIIFIDISHYYLTPFEEKLQIIQSIIKNGGSYQNILLGSIHQNYLLPFRPFLKLVYNFLCLYIYISTINNLKQRLLHNVPQYKRLRNWLLIIISSSFLISIVVFLLNMQGVQSSNKFLFISQEYYIVATILILYILMNASLFAFPEILYGMSFNGEMNTPQPYKNEYAVLQTDMVDTDNSNHLDQLSGNKNSSYTFTDEYLAKIEQSIDEQIKGQLFLDVDFNLDKLSAATGIPKHRLSMYFNTIINQSFSEWKNKLRIEFAVALFSTEQSKNFTIQALSSQCGFANQTSFIKAFKHVTGQTPSDFYKK